VKDAKRYEHTALEGHGQHLGHDFAVAWRHSCQQHADATPRTVRRLASAGFPPPGPGPVGADLALALAALADEFVDQGPVQLPTVIWHADQYDESGANPFMNAASGGLWVPDRTSPYPSLHDRRMAGKSGHL
jgi:hypothetical protein